MRKIKYNYKIVKLSMHIVTQIQSVWMIVEEHYLRIFIQRGNIVHRNFCNNVSLPFCHIHRNIFNIHWILKQRNLSSIKCINFNSLILFLSQSVHIQDYMDLWVLLGGPYCCVCWITIVGSASDFLLCDNIGSSRKRVFWASFEV